MEENTTPVIENGSDNTNHNENHVNSVKNTSDVVEAHQLMAQGKRNMVCGEVHHAVSQFQQACELLGKKYGELADECAEAYFCYGRALLEFARSDNGVLGNAMDSVSSEEDADSVSDEETPASAEGEKAADSATTEDGVADANEAAAQEEDETSVASEDNSVELEDEEVDGGASTSAAAAAGDDGDENKENIAQSEEEISNLQLAWEMLEVAKVIFTRHETKEAKLKLSEIYLNLGEIGLESGQFSQAIDDFRACLKLRQELLEADDRCLAETFYQLGLACTYNANYDDALLYYRQAIDVINIKLSALKQLVTEGEAAGKGPDLADFDDPVYKARREIEDLQSILPDIVGKMEDTQDEKKNADLVKRMMRETMALPPASDGSCSSKSLAPLSASSSSQSLDNQSKEPTNITHLVRKKRKPEEAASDSSSKKQAVENGNSTTGNGDSTTSTNGN